MDNSILEMALVGYEAEVQRIEIAMAGIRSQLGVRSNGASSKATAEAKPRRHMSASGKRRVALAQKRRWAAFHAKQSSPAPKTAAKRKMSPAAKAKLVANLKKARAAKAAKKTSGEAVPF